MNNVGQEIDHSLASVRDILMRGERTKRQEEIPVDLIVTENALIDPQHAESLAESMMGDRKQISPVTLAARLVDGQVTYLIIDGFHRAEGKKIIQNHTGEKQSMLAVVLYGCTDEELYDLRVLAASSVKSIKFARMAEWMKQSFLNARWENTKIPNLIRGQQITLSQVFSLVNSDGSGGRLHLAPGEAEELKSWALKKSKQWGQSIPSLMIDMRTVELSAPDLVQRVRTGGGGKDGKGVLTRARLAAIAKNLPGDWEAQRLFVDLAVDQNILAEDLDFLSFVYIRAREAGDLDTMTAVLAHPEKYLNPPRPVETDEKPSHTAEPDPSDGQAVVSHKKERRQHTRKTRNLSDRLEKQNIAGKLINEESVIKMYKVAEVVNLLVNNILDREGDNLEILRLPTEGTMSLNTKDRVLSLNGASVQLEFVESRLMTIFYVLEGFMIPVKLLAAINKNFGNIPIQNSVNSLRGKILKLSDEAAIELVTQPNGDCVWLQE